MALDGFGDGKSRKTFPWILDTQQVRAGLGQPETHNQGAAVWGPGWHDLCDGDCCFPLGYGELGRGTPYTPLVSKGG